MPRQNFACDRTTQTATSRPSLKGFSALIEFRRAQSIVEIFLAMFDRAARIYPAGRAEVGRALRARHDVEANSAKKNLRIPNRRAAECAPYHRDSLLRFRPDFGPQILYVGFSFSRLWNRKDAD
jgi:hypothetical protein